MSYPSPEPGIAGWLLATYFLRRSGMERNNTEEFSFWWSPIFSSLFFVGYSLVVSFSDIFIFFGCGFYLKFGGSIQSGKRYRRVLYGCRGRISDIVKNFLGSGAKSLYYSTQKKTLQYVGEQPFLQWRRGSRKCCPVSCNPAADPVRSLIRYCRTLLLNFHPCQMFLFSEVSNLKGISTNSKVGKISRQCQCASVYLVAVASLGTLIRQRISRSNRPHQ